jgi:hypothetical protein
MGDVDGGDRWANIPPMARVVDRTSRGIMLAVCLLAVAGCVSVRTTGADTVRDLQAEEGYKAVYAEQMAIVRAASQLLAPTGSNPGVCNAGGSQQDCYDADLKLIEGLQAMAGALQATPVPPRYVAADRLLKEAIAEDIKGLELRNQAIAQQDDAAWTEHKTVLEAALAMYQKAYQAFPEDNRPQPAP